MKKVKMMLLSLGLFAVVGGALAFKAKYSTSYCTAPTQQGIACAQKFCPNIVANSTTLNAGTQPFVCTALPVDGQCQPNTRCAGASTRLTTN